MNDPWDGLNNFMATMGYWKEVQDALFADALTRSDPRTLGRVYLDGDRVVIPSALDANQAEIYTNYSICCEGPRFSLRKSGRGDRGHTFSNVEVAWFGIFGDAAKYFSGSIVATPIRLALQPRLDPVEWRWLDAGLPPNWSSIEEAKPSGIVPGRRFFRTDQPDRYYFTDASDNVTAWVLDLTWDQIVTVFSEGIGSAARVARPTFS
ncbi:hypothetical protein [Gordonia crocea]|nr:hypothetical protein [Gordonia crocea]